MCVISGAAKLQMTFPTSENGAQIFSQCFIDIICLFKSSVEAGENFVHLKEIRHVSATSLVFVILRKVFVINAAAVTDKEVILVRKNSKKKVFLEIENKKGEKV